MQKYGGGGMYYLSCHRRKFSEGNNAIELIGQKTRIGIASYRASFTTNATKLTICTFCLQHVDGVVPSQLERRHSLHSAVYFVLIAVYFIHSNRSHR